jgi:hypothetical protein
MSLYNGLLMPQTGHPAFAACGTAPILAVAVPAFGIYGEDSNRKLQFVGFEPNACPFRR